MNIFQFVLYSSDSSSERKVEDRVYERPQNQIILLIQSGCMKTLLLAEISFFLFPTEEKDIIYIFEFLDFSRIRKVWNLWLYPGTERNTAYKTKKKIEKLCYVRWAEETVVKEAEVKGFSCFKVNIFQFLLYLQW